MKTWIKILIVCLSGAAIWGSSYLISLNPEMANMLASINVAITAVCSFFTGYPQGDK